VLEETFDEVDNILFANSLMGATIQDGGKRERSIFDTLHYTTLHYHGLAIYPVL